ncbi:MAG: lytic murein transglycosylase B [Proteobacteria bacterium]|nr:lytic murein transglycosylase B [Pseudomonadota bacterium]
MNQVGAVLVAVTALALGGALPACAAAAAAPAKATAHGKPAHAAKPVAQRAPDAAARRAFAVEFADESGLPVKTIERWLAAARVQPAIIQAMDRPLLAPPKWYEYGPPFLAPNRVAAGVAFWDAHEDTLARAEREYGVPPAIIVAILGIETHWGRNVGRYRALDALSTLAFEYPRRARFFRDELKAYLTLAQQLGVKPDVPVSSYAGALGMPQFMPSSYQRYAVDFEGNGRVDLWHSDADVIGSVAHFLVEHDWQRGQPTLLPAAMADGAKPAAMARLDGGISERRPLAAWRDDGVTPVAPPADLADAPVGLLLLEDAPDASSLYVACENFYVITRYNKSRLYAAAVVELAAALEAARAATPR